LENKNAADILGIVTLKKKFQSFTFFLKKLIVFFIQ